MLLSQALRLERKSVIAFVGAGGKTTALRRLSEELLALNWRVVVTTTTRLFASQVPADETITWKGETLQALPLRKRLAQRPRLFLVGEPVDVDKVGGVPPGLVDDLSVIDEVDAVLVEADGARLKPFKAPAAHEPVVPRSTTVLVPTVGLSVIGAPLDVEHVHRPELVAARAGVPMGVTITPEMVARALVHPEGGIKAKPARARVVPLLNQVDGADRLVEARTIARLLLAQREIDAVMMGSVQEADPIRETHRRVASIVLAAGAGTRMGTAIKQLLPWRGKTLVEHAVHAANQSSVAETVVVLGARAEEIRTVLHDLPVRIVVNPDWAEGHSTSIRTGLAALGPEIDAAIFINADQPFLTSSMVDQIILRYRETDHGIVASRYAGKRGSPVLFQRQYFGELMGLKGEEGGREVLMRYPVEYVDLAAEGGIDVDTPEEYGELGQ